MAASPFPISTPRDLLNKAKREIDRLEEMANGVAGEPDAVAIADLTVNAAWSLWHATDWIGFRALDVVRYVVPEEMSDLGPGPGCIAGDRERVHLTAKAPESPPPSRHR